MRTKVHVHVIYAEGEANRLARALRAAGIDDTAVSGRETFGSWHRSFWDASPELDQLEASLADHGIEWAARTELDFSERELSEATLLWLHVARVPKAVGGAAAGTTTFPTRAPLAGREPSRHHPSSFERRKHQGGVGSS